MTRFSKTNFKHLKERNDAIAKMRSKHLEALTSPKSHSSLKKSARKTEANSTSASSLVNHQHYAFSKPVTLEDDELEVLARHGRFIISSDEKTALEKQASRAYTELSALFQKAKHEKGIYLSLSWPVGMEWATLPQAILSKENSFNSEKSCRMLTYPTVQSGYSRLNTTRFPMQDFLRHGRQAANDVTNGLSKDLTPHELVCLHLNQLEHDDDVRKNPAISSAIPLFEWKQDTHAWDYYGKGYFNDVSVALHHHKTNTVGQKNQIKELALTKEDPNKAKEALFRLGRGLGHKELKQALFNIGSQLDVVTIDARKKLLNSIKNWRGLLKEIVAHFAYSDTPPSLVLLTDSTDVYAFFVSVYWSLLKDKEGREIKALKHLNFLKLQREPWAEENVNFNELCRSIELAIEVTDTSTLYKIRELLKIARDEEKINPAFAGALFKSIGFLRWVLNLPVGQDVINDWLNSISDTQTDGQLQRTASRYSWKRHALDLYSQAQSDASFNRVTFNKFSKLCESLIKSNNGSCIDKALIETIEALQAKGKRIFVLVDKPIYVELLYTLLREHFSEAMIDTILISDSSKLMTPGKDVHLIIAGGQINRIQRVLLCMPHPDSVTLILDAYSALLIKQSIETLRAFDAYLPIHDRIDDVLSILSPKLKSIEQLGGEMTLPVELSIKDGFYSYSYLSGDSHAVINLSGYESLPVAEGTTLIKRSVSASGNPSFLAVTVSDLAEGDEVVCLSEHVRSQMGEIIQSQAGQITIKAEEYLVKYFEIAANNIKTHFKERKRIRRARAIFEKMASLDAEVAKLSNLESVGRWIKHIETSQDSNGNQEDEPITTNSPKDECVFLLFARAINIEETLAKLFWDHGIRNLRIAHIYEGRVFSNHLRKLLTGDISKDDVGFDDDQMALIYDIAERNSYPVDMIIYKSEDTSEENK